MKKGFNILLILCAGLMVMSCGNKTKSYTDMLKAQNKAIDRLFDANGFVEIKDFPKDSKFKDNEFYKMSNDVYIQVVDTGNGNRAIQYSTIIMARFTAHRFTLDSTQYRTRYSNYGEGSNGTSPVEFVYGYTTVRAQAATTENQSAMESFMSEGLQVGLQYVGENGKVKLIVPFKRGSSTDNDNGLPVYFEEMQYKFLK